METQPTTTENKVPFERKPVQDIRFRRSKDGKYVLVDVVQTWIFSQKYFEALAKNTKASDATTSNA